MPENNCIPWGRPAKKFRAFLRALKVLGPRASDEHWGILAASAICDAPVLSFLNPALGTVALICATAKVRLDYVAYLNFASTCCTQTVQGNRQSAAELASHARIVTPAHVVDLAAPGCEDTMAPLCS